MELKFAATPGGGSFAPGAGPTWFESVNHQVVSLWTGEVALVLTGILAAMAVFVLLQAQFRGAGGRRPRRHQAEILRTDPTSMNELRHARMPMNGAVGNQAGF